LFFNDSPHGQTFNVTAPSILLPSPPPVGAIVSFSFDNAARRDVPVNPKVYRVRRDVAWEEVVQNALRDKHLQQFQGKNFFFFFLFFFRLYLLSIFVFLVNFSTRPVGHWTGKNMRLMMMNVAKSRNLDPLIANTWYSISSDEILKYKVFHFFISLF